MLNPIYRRSCFAFYNFWCLFKSLSLTYCCLTAHGLDNTGVILQHRRGWMFPRWLFTLLLFYSGGSGEVRLNPPCSRWQELLNLQGFSPARRWDRCQRSDSAFCLLFAVIRACVSGSSRSWMTPLKRFWTLQEGPKSTNFSFTSAPKSLMQNTHVSVIKPAAPGPVSRSQLTKSDWLKGRCGILWNVLEGEGGGSYLTLCEFWWLMSQVKTPYLVPGWFLGISGVGGKPGRGPAWPSEGGNYLGVGGVMVSQWKRLSDGEGHTQPHSLCPSNPPSQHSFGQVSSWKCHEITTFFPLSPRSKSPLILRAAETKASGT